MTDEQKPREDLMRNLAEEQASVLAGLAPHTIVITREGETPVEWLSEGDDVLTRDRGFQPIVWINRTKLDRDDLRAFPELAPVTIPANAFGENAPCVEVTVSPRQLFLVRNPRAQLDYGHHEVLVPAVSLGTQIKSEALSWNSRVSYAHILLASHQMLLVDGAWLGSLFTGTLGEDLSHSSCTITARLENKKMRAARPILSVDEGRALMKEIWADEDRRNTQGIASAEAV